MSVGLLSLHHFLKDFKVQWSQQNILCHFRLSESLSSRSPSWSCCRDKICWFILISCSHSSSGPLTASSVFQSQGEYESSYFKMGAEVFRYFPRVPKCTKYCVRALKSSVNSASVTMKICLKQHRELTCEITHFSRNNITASEREQIVTTYLLRSSLKSLTWTFNNTSKCLCYSIYCYCSETAKFLKL